MNGQEMMFNPRNETKLRRQFDCLKLNRKERRELLKNLALNILRLHILRHFEASILDAANVPIGSIQRILGHENRTTTEIYLHAIGNAEKDAMDALNACFESELSEKVPHQVIHQQKKGLTIVP